MKKYILNETKYEDYYAVIDSETGKELMKISKKCNTKENIKKQFPELEDEAK